MGSTSTLNVARQRHIVAPGRHSLQGPRVHNAYKTGMMDLKKKEFILQYRSNLPYQLQSFILSNYVLFPSLRRHAGHSAWCLGFGYLGPVPEKTAGDCPLHYG